MRAAEMQGAELRRGTVVDLARRSSGVVRGVLLAGGEIVESNSFFVAFFFFVGSVAYCFRRSRRPRARRRALLRSNGALSRRPCRAAAPRLASRPRASSLSEHEGSTSAVDSTDRGFELVMATPSESHGRPPGMSPASCSAA